MRRNFDSCEDEAIVRVSGREKESFSQFYLIEHVKRREKEKNLFSSPPHHSDCMIRIKKSSMSMAKPLFLFFLHLLSTRKNRATTTATATVLMMMMMMMVMMKGGTRLYQSTRKRGQPVGNGSFDIEFNHKKKVQNLLIS